MTKEKINLICRGKKISAIITSPTKQGNSPIIIMVHGGPGGSKSGPGNMFEILSEALVKRGIASLRFDFLGEGESEGDYIDMTFANQREEFLHVLHYVRQKGYKTIGLLGDSYGAATVISEFSYDINCLGLVWPTIDLLNTSFNTYLSKENLLALEKNGFIKEGDKRIGQAFVDELMKSGNILHHVKKIQVPTIIFHGDKDLEVPYQQSKAIFHQLVKPKQLYIIKNAGHAISDKKNQSFIIEKLVNWFQKYLN